MEALQFFLIQFQKRNLSLSNFGWEPDIKKGFENYLHTGIVLFYFANLFF